MSKEYKIGYIRVSMPDQNPDLQLQGIDLDEKIVEIASGKDPNRPELESLLKRARPGDVVYVQSIDRIARNVIDLRNIINTFNEKKVKVVFVREGFSFTGNDSPTSIFFLNIMGSVAEFERNLMKERQREGIEAAKKRGFFTGRKACLSKEQIDLLKERVKMGVPVATVAKQLGVSRTSVYKYLH